MYFEKAFSNALAEFYLLFLLRFPKNEQVCFRFPEKEEILSHKMYYLSSFLIVLVRT